MTSHTVCYGINVFNNLVLDIQVALIAFNLMGGNMGGMHEVRVIEFVEPVHFPMAFITVFSGDFTIADDSLAVAFVAFKSVVKNRGVIKPGSFFGNQFFFMMAVVTFPYIRIMITFLKVTDKAGAFCNSNMLPLNNLGMTARAAELLPSFEISEVNFMVKGNPLELHLPFQKSFLMTSAAKTALVRNFSPGL